MSMRKVYARISLGALVLFAFTAAQTNAGQAVNDIESVVRDEAAIVLRDAKLFALGDNPLKISMRETIKYYPADDAEIRRLAERVARSPEHPDKGRLDLWQRHRSGEFTVFDHQIYIGGDGIIRLATDRPSREDGRGFDGELFEDSAIGPGGESWNLTPIVLIADDGSAPAPAIGRIDGIMNMALYGLGRPFDPNAASLAPLSVRDGVAVMDLSNSSGTAEVVWVFGQLSTRAWRLAEARLPQKILAIARDHWPVRVVYRDYKDFDVLPRDWPSRAIVLAKDGQIDREFSIQSIEEIDWGDVRALVEIPSSADPDPLRGWRGQEVASTDARSAETGRNNGASDGPPEKPRSILVIVVIAGAVAATVFVSIVVLRRMGIVS